MKQISLLLLILSLPGWSVTSRAVSGYPYYGPDYYNQAAYGRNRGGSAYRPPSANGYWVPVAVHRPVVTNYGGTPVYTFTYVPAGYAYVPPSYPPQGVGPNLALQAAAGPLGPNPAMPSYAPPPGQLAYSQPPPGWIMPRPGTPAPSAHSAIPAKDDARVEQLTQELARVKRERNEAMEELSAWTALGVTREQIKAFKEQLVKMQQDNHFLVNRNNDLEMKLSWYLGAERDVPMPADLVGKVVNVNPQYGFVVLNVGRQQGAARNGKLLVNHQGKLVAKVRIASVEANASVANIIPGWRVSDVITGDEVIHQ